MKILIVATHGNPTEGWGTETLTSVKGLLERGHSVELLVHRKADDLTVPQHVLLPEPLVTLRSPLALLKTASAIRRCVKQMRPDIVHMMTEPYVLAFPLLRWIMRLPPVVLTANGTYAIAPLRDWRTRSLMLSAYRHVAHILAISTYTIKRMHADLQRISSHLAADVEKKTMLWTLGIEIPSSMPQRQHHDDKQLVFVGGLKPRKGVRELIEACAVFRTISALPFHLHLIGSAPDTGYVRGLKSRVVELGMKDTVTFHGQVPDDLLSQMYSDADVFSMLSIAEGIHFEGYGLVFLEANARGVPVVGPNDSGCTDVIVDGRSGYTADPKNPAQVAEKMKWILEDKKIDSQTCIAWAKEHNIARQAVEMERVYQASMETSLLL